VRAFSSSISRHAQQVFAPRRDEIDDENDDQAVAHHRQADQHSVRQGPAPSILAASISSCGTSWNMLRMIKMLIAS